VKKIFFISFFAITALFAEVTNIYPKADFFVGDIKVIDVRTAPEWKQTGIVEDSILITFFDENGKYNINEFLKELHKYVKKGEEFALICRSGNRTSLISSYLDSLGYRVINLKGGVNYLKEIKYPLVNMALSFSEE